MPIEPCCQRQLFGANLAVGDEARNGFPTTAVPPRASHTCHRMQGCVFHGNPVGVGLTRSTITFFAPFEMSLHGSEALLRGLIILGFIQDGGSYRLLTSPVNPPSPV